MVLAWDPTVDVDAASDPSTADHPVDQNGGTIQQTVTGTDMDAVHEVQGPTPQANPWQEFNLFVGEIARTQRISPGAAIVLIEQMCQANREQTYWCGGFKGLGPLISPPIG